MSNLKHNDMQSFKVAIGKKRDAISVFAKGSFKTHDGNVFSYNLTVIDGKVRLEIDYDNCKSEILNYSCLKRLMLKLKEYRRMKMANIITVADYSDRISLCYSDEGDIMQF